MINLNYRDARPIYEQIKDELRRLIISGALGGDERLPSVRDMAANLAINPNTIQRAYRELEMEGYIYTVSGKGSYAAPQDGISTARIQRLLTEFDAHVSELLFLGMTSGELVRRIESANTAGNNDTQGTKGTFGTLVVNEGGIKND